MQSLVILVLISASAYAQNVAINNDQSLPNPNAILDIKSGTKRLLIPRMDSVARKVIFNTKGLLVYDTTYNSFWFNNGTSWQNLSNGYVWALGLDFISRLRPVSYLRNNDENKKTEFGFIAQEVEESLNTSGISNVGMVSRMIRAFIAFVTTI